MCMACSDQLKAMDSELSSFASQRTTSAVGPTSKPTQQQTRADAARSSPRAEQPSTDTAMCPSCSHNPAQQSCNSCGLDFCGNCTVEVKKFLLGATCECVHDSAMDYFIFGHLKISVAVMSCDVMSCYPSHMLST